MTFTLGKVSGRCLILTEPSRLQGQCPAPASGICHTPGLQNQQEEKPAGLGGSWMQGSLGSQVQSHRDRLEVVEVLTPEQHAAWSLCKAYISNCG